MNRDRVIQLFLLAISLFLFRNVSYSQTPTLSSSYKIRHTSTARSFESRKFIHTRDNATIIAGKWGASQDEADLLIMKLNERGQVSWSKKVAVGIRLDQYELTEMSDGSIVFIGNSQYNSAPTNSDMLLIKFTCEGDVTWSRNLTMPASVFHLYMTPYSIKEGKNNDAIISFYGGGSGLQYAVICQVNSQGSLVWSKTFYGTDPDTNLLPVAFYANDKIWIFGFQTKYSNSYVYNKSFFAMKLNYTTGATEDSRGYNYAEFTTNYGVLVTHPKVHFYAEQLTNGEFALFGVFSNFSQQTGYYFKLLLKADLTINRATAFSTPRELSQNYSKIKVFPNGQTHIVSAIYESQRFYWYAADGFENKIREQKTIYPNTYIDLRYAAEQSGTNRSMYVLSTSSTTVASNGVIEVVQSEDNDSRMLPCLGTDTSFITTVPWDVYPGTIQWQSVKDNEALLTPLQFNSSAINVTSTYSCEPLQTSAAGTAKITIQGRDTVCFSTAARQYVARKVNQSAPVKWRLDSVQNGVLTEINDSTVSVNFASPGTQPKRLKLYAFAGSCPFTIDSMQVIVLPPSQKLSAGVSACDVPFTLHPGPWFKSYLWQDGSTDSLYTVTQPGLYYVTITDACGNILRDSLNFVPAAAVPLDIGPDRTKCNSDTIHLSANAGFIGYTWSNNYNISSLTAQNVVVTPLVDTSYYIKAAIGPGCFAYDTVHIKVYQSPAVNIGVDTSFCFGDSAIIKASNGFSSYLWSNSASAQTITVKTAGIYSIIVTNAQGCRSYDTLQVLQVYPLPAVQLNKSGGLCVGETRTLDAGVFASYVWQDGSKARTFEVKNTGNYFVTVSDANGCQGSDTASITKILPLPQGFFRSDTTICIGGKIELKPVSLYKSYLWSMGETTPSVIITQPGLYWLAVEDKNNCKGTDSITVNPKECPVGFYVPTAFTPNSDGKNDIFRPVLVGNLKRYQFAIYNRLGQAVFQSSEPGKGWNGNIAGVPQQTAAFTWNCSYQFEGGEMKLEKGTVVLIR